MSGYLNWKEPRKAWKKQWFVLIDRVLYVYAASEDIAAVRGIPILGYQVELMSGGEVSDFLGSLVHCTGDWVMPFSLYYNNSYLSYVGRGGG